MASQTATSDNNQDDHQTLDALRSSFRHLHSGIDTFLQKDFVRLDPIDNVENTGLPSWSTIYHASNNISSNLSDTTKLLTRHSSFLQEAHAHPNTTFPVDRMNMVGELLRRQPGLEAKTWLDSTLNLGLTLDSDPDEEGEKITSAEWQDLWDFADWQHNVVGKEIWEGEEMEEGDEEDEDEEGDEEGVGEAVAAEEKGKGRVVEKAEPLMPLEDILRYLHSGGVLPVGGPPLTG